MDEKTAQARQNAQLTQLYSSPSCSMGSTGSSPLSITPPTPATPVSCDREAFLNSGSVAPVVGPQSLYFGWVTNA